MHEALLEAHRCLRFAPDSQPAIPDLRSDVPIGAVCVVGGQIVGRGHNRREADQNPTAHAEVLALQDAARTLGRRHLDDVTLYVTLEPCPMCAGAIWLARVQRLVFGAWDQKAGACGSLYDIVRDPRLNHRPQVRGGILAEECADLLAHFFAEQRHLR